MKASILFARFPFGNAEVPSSSNWMMHTVVEAKSNPLVGDIWHREYDNTPITMTRNKAMKDATELGADFILMLDSDMMPDIGLTREHAIPGSRPFFPAALEFAMNHRGPCVVGAPYCGPPPHENVYIFLPANKQGQHPNVDFQLDMLSREHAAQRAGFEEVAALPTGVILIDMRCVKNLRHPYFDYEWTDHTASEKGSTEDVYFSRNLSLAGVRQYVLWDAWAGHWKRKLVTKPQPWTMDVVRENIRDAVVAGQLTTERLVMVGEERRSAPQSIQRSRIDAFGNHYKTASASPVASKATSQPRPTPPDLEGDTHDTPRILPFDRTRPQPGECRDTVFGAGPQRP